MRRECKALDSHAPRVRDVLPVRLASLTVRPACRSPRPSPIAVAPRTAQAPAMHTAPHHRIGERSSSGLHLLQSHARAY